MIGKRIVWVDDEHAQVALLVRPLQSAGYRITCYRTYGQVMENLEEVQQSDLLIMDLIIPPGRAEVEARYLGLELLKKLRKLGINQPVIVMSVVSQSRVHKELEPITGIVDFISKTSPEPIEEQLLETVRTTLSA